MIRLNRACAPLLFALFAVAARADDFSGYDVRLALAFHFPTNPGPALRGPTVFENLADGRLIAVSTLLASPTATTGTAEIYLESSAGSRSFQFAGNLPLPSGGSWQSFGGAFLEVSPSGQSIAVGDNSFSAPHVGVFAFDDLVVLGSNMPVDWYAVPHFGAAWLDDRLLAVTQTTGAASSGVAVLDTHSPVAMPDVRPVIGGIGGAPAGVALDAQDRLVAANGFDFAPGGSSTGTIKRFDSTQWRAALAGGLPVDFESTGNPFGQYLSASSLEFDREGNLLIGGSDFFGGGDSNYLAISRETSTIETRTFDPDAAHESSYVLAYNEATAEIYAYQPFALVFGEPVDHTLVHLITPPLPGDATGEGLVTGADFTIWADNFGQFAGNAMQADGDFNQDGFVTGADYTIWADHFDDVSGNPLHVPEPAGVVLLAIGAAIIARPVAPPNTPHLYKGGYVRR